MFKFFKKKAKKFGLEEAKDLKLITEEEFWILKVERAKVDLKHFLNKGKKKMTR